jgi:hypothetical protein
MKDQVLDKEDDILFKLLGQCYDHISQTQHGNTGSKRTSVTYAEKTKVLPPKQNKLIILFSTINMTRDMGILNIRIKYDMQDHSFCISTRRENRLILAEKESI